MQKTGKCSSFQQVSFKKHLGSWENADCMWNKNIKSPCKKLLQNWRHLFSCVYAGQLATVLKKYCDTAKLLEQGVNGALRGCEKGINAFLFVPFFSHSYYLFRSHNGNYYRDNARNTPSSLTYPLPIIHNLFEVKHSSFSVLFHSLTDRRGWADSPPLDFEGRNKDLSTKQRHL